MEGRDSLKFQKRGAFCSRTRQMASEDHSLRPVDGKPCCLLSCPVPDRLIGADHAAFRLSVQASAAAAKRLSNTAGAILSCWASPKQRAHFHADCWQKVLGALSGSAVAGAPAAKRGRRAGGAEAEGGAKGGAGSLPESPLEMPSAERAALEASLDACDPERFDSVPAAKAAAVKLATLLRASKHSVVFTGAGVSVSAGIPDYRGTAGVDVVGFDMAAEAAAEAAGKDAAKPKGKAKAKSDTAGTTSSKKGATAAASTEPLDLHGLSSAAELSEAMSLSQQYTSLAVTPTHRALATLHARGLLQYTITQNCDGLHRRAGTPREALCVLHGDVYTEFCERCEREYERPYCVDLYSTDCKKERWFKKCKTCGWGHYTGRTCTAPAASSGAAGGADAGASAGSKASVCGGALRDTIVNFGDDLHEKVLGGLPAAEASCRAADVIMCVGSSLTVTPACDLPRLLRKGASIAIVNLQETPLDRHKAVAVRSFFPSDAFFRFVMEELGRGHDGAASSAAAAASSAPTAGSAAAVATSRSASSASSASLAAGGSSDAAAVVGSKRKAPEKR